LKIFLKGDKWQNVFTKGVMDLAFLVRDVTLVVQCGVKMAAVQELTIRNKQAGLMGQHAKAVEKEE